MSTQKELQQQADAIKVLISANYVELQKLADDGKYQQRKLNEVTEAINAIGKKAEEVMRNIKKQGAELNDLYRPY